MTPSRPVEPARLPSDLALRLPKTDFEVLTTANLPAPRDDLWAHSECCDQKSFTFLVSSALASVLQDVMPAILSKMACLSELETFL